MRRLFLSFATLLLLAACGAEPIWAPDEQVAAAKFVADGPKSVTLYTVINNHNGTGAHSALLINGSQRVMFDPAGSWHLPSLPERNDVFYGINDKMVKFYIDYHARKTFRVVEQTVVVSPQVAETVLQLAVNNGAVAKSQCASSVSHILRQTPGFEAVSSTLFPKQLMQSFAKIPGVTERTITDDDADDNHGVLIIQSEDPRLQ